MELAQHATKRFRKRGDLWLVPSASHPGTYVVDIDGDAPSCTCPDHEKTNAPCKHIYAVEFTIQREPDGTVTETIKVKYTQDWSAYNAAQTHEQERLADLLRHLCDGIEQPSQGRGRPRLPLSDVVFATAMKIYLASSGRRTTSALRDYAAKGYLSRAPHYNSLFNYLEKPELTPLLKGLIEESAAPLKAVETDFAVDASGFSTSVYERWFDHKWGRKRSIQKWVKAHIMVGVKTNIVTSVEVTAGEGPGTGDCSNFLPLVQATQQRFAVQEVSADKAYLTHANVQGVMDMGAEPFIPFKSNSSGQTGPEAWKRMWHFFQLNRPGFLAHYHKRSNVETAFSMIKMKFGAAVRSKTLVAQVNEVLLKVLCHNLCCLIHAIYELRLEPVFWAGSGGAHQLPC